MRILLTGLIIVGFLAGAGWAEEKAASAAQIKKYAVGHDINCGGATLHYGKDGRYTYNGADPGRYRISAGKICVDFDNGNRRCDSIVVDGGAYTLINSGGQRFGFSQ